MAADTQTPFLFSSSSPSVRAEFETEGLFFLAFFCFFPQFTAPSVLFKPLSSHDCSVAPPVDLFL
jgi:hypothetical protein